MEYFVAKSCFGNLDHNDVYLNAFQKSICDYIDDGFKPIGQIIINTDNNGNGCYYQTMIKEELPRTDHGTYTIGKKSKDNPGYREINTPKHEAILLIVTGLDDGAGLIESESLLSHAEWVVKTLNKKMEIKYGR